MVKALSSEIYGNPESSTSLGREKEERTGGRQMDQWQITQRSTPLCLCQHFWQQLPTAKNRGRDKERGMDAEERVGKPRDSLTHNGEEVLKCGLWGGDRGEEIGLSEINLSAWLFIDLKRKIMVAWVWRPEWNKMVRWLFNKPQWLPHHVLTKYMMISCKIKTQQHGEAICYSWHFHRTMGTINQSFWFYPYSAVTIWLSWFHFP